MNDDTLERSLRETLTAVAVTTEVKDRWNEIAAAPVPARRERRPLLIATAAFAVVLVTVGSFALVSTLIGGDRDFASPPLDPAETTSVSKLRYPVPGYIPAGADEVWAQIPVRDPASPSVVTAVLGRRTSLDGGGFGADIEEITAVHVRRSVPEDATAEGEIVAVGDREVRLTEGALTGSVGVMWTDGDVTAIVGVSDGDVDRALDTVAGVSWSGDDPTVPGAVVVDPPEGLELIAEPIVTSDVPGPMVTMQWDDAIPPATVPGAPPPMVDVLQIDVWVSEDSPEILLAPHPVAQSFELRGRPAYLVWSRDYSSVIWEEAPGFTVTVSGWLTDTTELIRIAENVEFTDEETWYAMFDLDGEPGVPPTMSETTSMNVGG